MKQLIYMLCCILVLSACKGKKAKDDTSDATTKQNKIETVKKTETANKANNAVQQGGKIRGIDKDEMLGVINNAKYDKDVAILIKTNKGDINMDLYATKTPKTVANFLGLIERKFYDGLNFHRVIPDFMVQGGCPFGTGRGNPGYKFEDEIVESLQHSGPGILSMANSGPATNGSQFFITHKATPWLNGKHTVFGKVKSDADMKVVNSIVQGDKIESVTILK